MDVRHKKRDLQHLNITTNQTQLKRTEWSHLQTVKQIHFRTVKTGQNLL